VIVVATVWAILTPQPDILVSSDGRHVGVRGADGLLHVMQTGKDAFLIREWLAADADARTVVDPSLTERVSCDEAGCVTAMRDGGLVTMADRPDAFEDDCVRAVVVVAPQPPPPDCSALVIDRSRLRRSGALAMRRVGGTLALEAQRPDGSDRPWSPQPADATPSGAPRVPVRGEDAAPPDPQDD
jgi:competence protein ComEC